MQRRHAEKILRAYDLAINARTLEVSSTAQASKTPGDAGGSAPSFDCSEARTPTEVLICSDAELASMERDMASAYKHALEQAPSGDKPDVMRKHRQWFADYARTCDASPSDADRRECIARHLRGHTRELGGSAIADQSAPAAGAPKAYRIGQGVSAPVMISKIEPEYSGQARQAKLQGSVKVQLIVDERGFPQQVSLVQSLGMGLDEKAVEAVRRWRFRPGMKDGRPVPVEAIIDVNFKLL
jgi:TonB family protein